jgi:hypothetical protein
MSKKHRKKQHFEKQQQPLQPKSYGTGPLPVSLQEDSGRLFCAPTQEQKIHKDSRKRTKWLQTQ